MIRGPRNFVNRPRRWPTIPIVLSSWVTPTSVPPIIAVLRRVEGILSWCSTSREGKRRAHAYSSLCLPAFLLYGQSQGGGVQDSGNRATVYPAAQPWPKLLEL